MIEIRVEDNALKKIEQKLGDMSSKAPSVMKKAVNETAKEAKKALAAKAKATYTVRNAKFTSVMKIKSATVGKPEAVISASGEPLPLLQFKVSRGKKVTKVQVIKEGSLKELKKSRGDIKAFVNNIANKNQVRKHDTAKGKAGTKVIHKAVAQREGKERLGIEEKYGNSVPVMLGSKRVFGEEEKNINEILGKKLEKHITTILEK